MLQDSWVGIGRENGLLGDKCGLSLRLVEESGLNRETCRFLRDKQLSLPCGGRKRVRRLRCVGGTSVE
ncbi:hypothetical protein BDN70DRAFT_731344 [Pholiota conissans]|uniref:Uncharacterized protein n=1 Tax=Pholiota conissans TaxID=109636 RepID=A0A9P5YZZ8_9AGAR|nr:hypothetical protein BDN70DRAFT_731344 [Pholiota conissans]